MNRASLYAACGLLATLSCSDSGRWTFPVENLDQTVSPAVDFYEFAVGGWRKNHPIPPDRSRWGVFDVVAARTQDRLKGILEEAETTEAAPGSEVKKIGDLYASGMNEPAIEVAGVTPILPELDRIDAIPDLDGLQAEIAHLQEIGATAAFDFGQMADPKDSTWAMGVADQGGLGLPDRSYYLAHSAPDRDLLKAYVEHVAAMLKISGEPADRARTDAEAVLQIETALATASLGRVERRDPYATYHPMGLADLETLTPHFSWPRWFTLAGRSDITRINVTVPAFFQTLDNLFVTVSLDAWKGYLRWHLVEAAAPYLSSDFTREQFAFRSRLTGVKAEGPRWARVLGAVNHAIGFALGRIYVERYFSADAKSEVESLLRNVQAALRSDLATLSWMTPVTRLRALEKLDLMTDHIGYPDRWLDYSRLTIDRGPFVLNMLRANAFHWRREMDKIDQRVDRDEWGMLPQTVNAYYDPSRNVIVFPAAILQAPFFDLDAPAAANYGGVGTVIGHEITHGFDDEGSRYDGHGNLVDWWAPEDAARFHARTQCISDLFSSFTVAGGAHVIGGLVTGEATADLGGVVLSHRAFHASAGQAAGQAAGAAGFTPDQLFFLSFAGVWASNVRPEQEVLLALVDPHPPARYRVNGTLANVPAFQAAFSVPAGSPMVHEPRCEIW